jgi:hypothetical protein
LNELFLNDSIKRKGLGTSYALGYVCGFLLIRQRFGNGNPKARLEGCPTVWIDLLKNSNPSDERLRSRSDYIYLMRARGVETLQGRA